MSVVAAELGYYSCTMGSASDQVRAAMFPMFVDEGWMCTGDETAFK